MKSSRACGGGGWSDEGSWGLFSSCLGFPTSLVRCLPTEKALIEERDRILGKSLSPILFLGREWREIGEGGGGAGVERERERERERKLFFFYSFLNMWD